MKEKIKRHIRKYKIIYIIIIFSIIFAVLLLNKSKCGFLNDQQCYTLLEYIGSIIGGITTLLAVIFSIEYGSLFQKPIIKIEDIRIFKKNRQIRDIICYVGYDENYQDSDSDEYGSILSFKMYNRGNSEAINIKTFCNKTKECNYDAHVDKESNDSDILTKDEKLVCTIVLSKNIALNDTVEFNFSVSFQDSFLNSYMNNYYIKIRRVDKNKYEFCKLTLVLDKKE